MQTTSPSRAAERRLIRDHERTGSRFATMICVPTSSSGVYALPTPATIGVFELAPTAILIIFSLDAFGYRHRGNANHRRKCS